jgi:uncharacterized protein (TIGR03435 family)
MMTTMLIDVSVRAVLIAVGAAAVLWALRIKAPSARHAAWTAVVITMLLLPVWSWSGLQLRLPVLRPAPTAAVDVVQMPSRPNRPAVADVFVPIESATPPVRPFNWQGVVLGTYLLGALVLLTRLGVGTVQAGRLRRLASDEHGRRSSDGCTTPITVGFLRPVLILPREWTTWPAEQLAAVLTHEREHLRRRDPLVQWIALLNRAVFWFHPLSWWLERRLSTLAEEACDLAVLAAGHSPQAYSAYLLDMAKSVSRDGSRVRVVGMAMPGYGLRSRLRQILEGMPAAPMSRARRASAVGFCVLLSITFAAGTLAERGRQEPAAGGPEKFDVVSIKPCASLETAQTGRGAGPNLAQTSPGHAYWACVTAAALIDQAYAGTDFPLLNVAERPMTFEPLRGDTKKRNRVRGGPSWMTTERFAIEATASADTISGRGNLMRLPPAMNHALRAMLAERFQLKVRRATEEQPMYALVVAPAGLKIKAPSPGDCTEWKAGMPRSPERGEKPYCGNVSHTAPLARQARIDAGADAAAIASTPGPNHRLEYSGVTMAEVARDLAAVMDHFVLDKTGFSGQFMFAVEFTSDESTPGLGGSAPDAPASGPRIFQALGALGLKLERTKGPSEYLIVDSLERPTPDLMAGASSVFTGSGPNADAPAAAVQTPAGNAAFDVASVKPCSDPPRALVGRRGGLKTIDNSANRLYLECITLESLANLAYAKNGDFAVNDHIEDAVRGGADWVRTDRFTVEATASGNPGAPVMMGAMLRALLEDRFELQIHHDTLDIPMYALTVAKGGLKIKPMAEGDCINDDSAGATPPTPAMFAAGKKIPCGSMRGTSRGSVRVWDFGGVTMADLADSLDSDRRILDQTGVKGNFIVHLEYERDEKVADGVNIFAALEQQLGLKLSSTKGPHDVIVIDRASRPRPDAPAESAITVARVHR